MRCEKCLNKENCGEECKHVEGEMMSIAVRFCPKCRKQGAEYKYNAVGNLVFVSCVCCGYSAKDYAKDLKGEK